MHTGYTLTSFKEEGILDISELYNVCVIAIEEHNKEIEKGRKDSNKDGPAYPDAQKQIDLYNELRQ